MEDAASAAALARLKATRAPQVAAPEIDVRSMMGGLTRGSEINTFEIVRAFGQALKAQCHYFAAPIDAESPQSSRQLAHLYGINSCPRHTKCAKLSA